jgi:hypothetical protein
MVKNIGGSICVCRPAHCYDIATDKLHQQQSSKNYPSHSVTYRAIKQIGLFDQSVIDLQK